MQRAISLFARQLAHQPANQQTRLEPVLRGLITLASGPLQESSAVTGFRSDVLVPGPSEQGCLLCAPAAAQQQSSRAATSSADFPARERPRGSRSDQEQFNSKALDELLDVQDRQFSDQEMAELEEDFAELSLEPELCAPTREEVEQQIEDMYKDYDSDEGEPEFDGVFNTAGNQQPAWEIADVDEEICATYWHWDLIGGTVFENEKNALLSDEAKKAIFILHKDGGLSTKALAKMFLIREQRVMAICALKQMEADAEASDRLKADEPDQFQVTMETEVYDCVETQGVGERHVVNTASYPRMQEDGRIRGGSHEDMDAQTLEDNATAIRQEKLMVKEFRQRLDYNIGKVGKGIERGSRATKLPQRPKQGWSLVVRVKGRKGFANSYVAQPDGSQRKPNDDETLLLMRATPNKRRALL